jgi:long-chain fatty acid transport protein
MRFTHRGASRALAVALAAYAGQALAGGFQIGVQSGSATGNAVAGGAAVAEDASVVWSNPAGMMHLKQPRQLSTALHILKPSFQFQNGGSTGAFAAPGTGEGGDGGDWAYVPSGFFTMPVNDRIRVGLGVNAPFGLKTSYDQGWRGQLIALRSKIETLNLNPSIAYRVNDQFSIGAGASVQKIKAELSSFTGAAALGNVDLDADDVGFGFNVGATFQATPSTRLGVSYRSRINHELEGRATFSGPAGAGFSGDVKGDLTVPDSLSLSVFHEAGQWEFMADVTRTGWDKIQQLTVVRTAPSLGGAAGTVFTTLPFLWDNTWRFGVGANYRMNDRVKLRMGFAFDETPTNDITRSPRLPDQDRKWVAIGVQYRIPGAGVLEVGYAHEFLKDPTVNNAGNPPIPGRLIGRFEAKADIITLSYSHPF